MVSHTRGMFDGFLPPSGGIHSIPRNEEDLHDHSPHCFCVPSHIPGYIPEIGIVNGWKHYSLKAPDYPPAA